MVEVDEWGNRNLAYEIKKKTRGFYYRFDYCGSGALVDELERFFRIDDRVMKYMTVLIEQHVDIEALKAEMAQAAQPEPAPATAAEPAAEATATEATPTETASETSAPETEASTTESESTEPKEEA
jgi:small subunit ribosomal protein S6